MNVLGNIVWIVFGGFAIAVEYFAAGIVMCLTIIGIPFGLQVFKLGALSLLPFGHRSVVVEENRGCFAFLMNVVWFFIGGVWIALTHLGLGLLFCVTIVGIPFGLQHFKLMIVAFSPFGREIVALD
ncbi:MAG TPA: YccF domain-containing protein [Rikenella microfusus]|nr:YccF domain-containing protein [Rikenella microfusus]HJE89020.1 YccF domain-containing protein [Rikenella microfusus]